MDQIRVLCVDGNHDAADTTAEVLRLVGYHVRACYDGATALTAAERFRPDVCVLDLGMPEMDGQHLAVWLRARTAGRRLGLNRVHAGRLTNLLIRSAAVGMARKRSIGRSNVYRYPRCVPAEMLDKRPAPGTDDAEPVKTLSEGDVRRAIAKLTERERRVVTLRFCDGLTYPEIRRQTGNAFATVKADERKGLDRLRGMLAAVG